MKRNKNTEEVYWKELAKMVAKVTDYFWSKRLKKEKPEDERYTDIRKRGGR